MNIMTDNGHLLLRQNVCQVQPCFGNSFALIFQFHTNGKGMKLYSNDWLCSNVYFSTKELLTPGDDYFQTD